MLTLLLVAAAVMLRVPLPVIAIAGLAVVSPWGLLAGAAVWAGLHRWREARTGPGPADEAAFLNGLAAELAAGASLRRALIAAAGRTDRLPLGPAVRLAAAGRPMVDVADRLRDALPVNGVSAAAACRLAAESGGRAAGVFGDLAVRASEAGEVERERRVATAQARWSAAAVVAVPPLVAVAVALTRSGSPLPTDAASRGVVMAGLGLQALGGFAVWAMLRASTAGAAP